MNIFINDVKKAGFENGEKHFYRTDYVNYIKDKDYFGNVKVDEYAKNIHGKWVG